MYAWVSLGGQKRTPDPSGLQLQAIGNLLTWVLGIEPSSSESVVCALNHRVIAQLLSVPSADLVCVSLMVYGVESLFTHSFAICLSYLVEDLSFLIFYSNFSISGFWGSLYIVGTTSLPPLFLDELKVSGLKDFFSHLATEKRKVETVKLSPQSRLPSHSSPQFSPTQQTPLILTYIVSPNQTPRFWIHSLLGGNYLKFAS